MQLRLVPFILSIISLSTTSFGSPVPVPDPEEIPLSLPLITPRDHQFFDSKAVPILKSGFAVLPSEFNVVYKEDDPNWHMTVEGKKALGNDTNRGFTRIIPHGVGGPLKMWGTLASFVIPEVARGKDCRFHFFLGAGDGAGGYSRLQLFKLMPGSTVEEFATNWNSRPPRQQHLGTFAIYPPQWLQDLYPTPDVVDTTVPNNHNDPSIVEVWTGVYQQMIVTKCPQPGTVAYDLVPAATMSNGISPTVAWSLNKGLVIEVLGVPRSQVPVRNPHDD